MAPRPAPIHWRSLICLTLIAAAIRFSFIDQPAIWGDEAASWRRVSGTYQQLVDELRSAGFQPAHYVITWWIKEGFPYAFAHETESIEDAREAGHTPGMRWGGPPSGGPPGRRGPPLIEPRQVVVPTARLIPGGLPVTPLLMRFVPALCGTLLVPAIYFLAGQLVARRTALLVAIFTCFSAYQLGYSRDAKMYEQFWCFATLHVACLLWWLAAYRRPEPIEPPTPTNEFPRQRELGLGVAGVLPAAHVGHIARAFTTYDLHASPPAAVVPPVVTRLDALVRWACWVTSGLAMIAFSAVGLGVVAIELLILLVTAPQRVGLIWRAAVALAAPFRYAIDQRRVRRLRRFAPTLSYEAPRAADGARTRLRERLRGIALPPIVGFALGAGAIVGLWWSYHDFTRYYERVTDTDSAVTFNVNDSGIEWVDAYNRGRTAGGLLLENASAYLVSWEWPKPDWIAGVEPRVFTMLSRAVTALLVAIALGVIPWRAAYARLRAGRRPRRRRRPSEPTFASIALPPPVDVERERGGRGPMPLAAMLIVVAWLLLPGYAFYTASGAWRPDGSRVRAATPTQAIAGAIFPTAYNDEARPLAGALSVDVANARAASESWAGLRARLDRRPWRELFVVHGLDWSTSRWRWAVPLALAGIAALIVSLRASARRRVLLDARIVGFVVLVWAALTLVYVLTPVQARSVWMPRYLGFVWPAFAIAACVLIRRLPLAPLRWATIALLLVANVANFAARLRYGEPPTPRIAADVARASRVDASRVFVFERARGGVGFGTPGSGSVFSMPDAFYVVNDLKLDTSPREAQGFGMGGMSRWAKGARDAADIARRLKADAAAREFTLWAELPTNSTPGDVDKELAAALAPAGWTRADDAERWTAYDHWTWRALYALERHRWVRGPTTKPAVIATARVPVRPPAAPTTHRVTTTRAIVR